MSDITLSDIERLQSAADETDVALAMDEDAFRGFYDRTSRGVVGISLENQRRSSARRRSAAGGVLSPSPREPSLRERSAPPQLPLSDCDEPRS